MMRKIYLIVLLFGWIALENSFVYSQEKKEISQSPDSNLKAEARRKEKTSVEATTKNKKLWNLSREDIRDIRKTPNAPEKNVPLKGPTNKKRKFNQNMWQKSREDIVEEAKKIEKNE